MADDVGLMTPKEIALEPARETATPLSAGFPPLSILAAAIGADDDEAAIGMAADIARRHASSVVVVNAFDPPPAAAMASGFGRGVLAAPVWQAISDRQVDIRQRISAIVARQALPAISIAKSEETGWLTLMRELPLADLVVLGQTGVAGEGLLGGPLGPALMEARIAVFVARGEHAFAGRPAAVAWDGSFEASRALRAAAPLLKAASAVAILQDTHRLDCARAPAPTLAAPATTCAATGSPTAPW